MIGLFSVKDLHHLNLGLSLVLC